MSGLTRGKIMAATSSFQGDAHRVLIVCSAGILRSPTAAVVLAQKFGHNTRSCGIDDAFALIPFSEILAFWADEIVCMSREHERKVKESLEKWSLSKIVVVLDIEDDYGYMDEKLQSMIVEGYSQRS